MVPRPLSLPQDVAKAVEAMPPMMAWAMSWASRGIPVLPCNPETKGPLIGTGKLAATLDQDQIREWWTTWPDAMIGGRMDGLVVLDCDAYKPGHRDDLAEHELPETLSFSTPGRRGRRGRHLVYRDPDGLFRSSKIGKNRTIDVRAGTSQDYIVLPPSRNALGEVYRVLRMATPAPAPDWLPRFDYSSPEDAPDLPEPEPLPELYPALVAAMQARVEDRSAHTVHVALAAAELGLTDGQIVTALEMDTVTQARRAEGKRRSPHWWPAELARVLAYVRSKVPGPTPPVEGDVSQAVRELVDRVRQYEFLKDETHLLAALAVAATTDIEGDPAWLLLVGPASSGKTSAVNLVSKEAHELDQASEAGLLSWAYSDKKGAPSEPDGLLARIGNGKRSLVTVADLSVLIRSDRSNRSSDLWSAMRRIHDGSYYRDVNPPGGRKGNVPRLEWHGRLTVIGAVTQDVDDYIGNNELGPRWLYFRMPEMTDDENRRAARMVFRDGRDEQKEAARELAAGVIASIGQCIEPAPGWLEDLAIDCALVTTYGRATVRREGRGRDLAGEPARESPARLTRQLATLGRGLLAAGCTRRRVEHMVRKTALDSMPRNRYRVLRLLSQSTVNDPASGPTTYHVARAAGSINWRTARVVLDDLELIGCVESWSEGNKHDIRQDDPTSVMANPEGADEADKRVMQWALVGDIGLLIARVIDSHIKMSACV